jgi:chaperonin GroEL (HSP60 family)
VAFCESFKGVIRGVLSPHYSVKVVESLTSAVTSSFNFDLPSSLFLEQVSIITQNFSQLVIKAIGSSTADSTTLDSFIIQRDFALHFEMSRVDCVNFVVMMCPVEGQINSEDGESIYLSRNHSLISFMKYQRIRIEKFVNMCKEQNISLVISAIGVPKYCLQVLSSHRISVIHFVEEEDLTFLSQMWRKSLVFEFPEEKFAEKEIFVASSCNRIIINGKACVQVTPRGEQAAPFTKTLLLTAPTDGLCAQLYTAIHKAIKAVYLSLNPTSLSLNPTSVSQNPTSLSESTENDCASITIQGGACFELVSSDFMFKCSKSKIDDEDLLIARMLGNAFLDVARTLHRNVSEKPQNQTHDFYIKLSNIKRDLNNSKCLGFDRRGALIDMEKAGVLDALSVKFHVVSCVMNLLHTILKTDSIIGVKNKSSKT